MTKMTTEEAFVKVLQKHGIQHAFGIIGSAFMPISDLFPKAGITFWDVAHENNGGIIADGYTRATGKMSMCIAQNGPGITNFVTPIKTAYWNHTPMLLVTPQAANKTIGQGGFQEVEQMALFKDMVCYQEEVRDPTRVAEVLNRVISKAFKGSAPAQINIPRDMWTQVIDIELPPIIKFERPSGGSEAIKEAAKLLSNADFPVILSGAGVVLADAINDCKALAEKLDSYGELKTLLVHRKGSTRAFPPHHPLIPVDYQYTGQPVLVGGTMGTCSYVLTGTEKGMHETFGSTCHGAGRARSRHNSRQKLSYEQVLENLKTKGISIRVASPKLVMEEAPESYKDVTEVVDTCHDACISKKCVKLRPIAVVKG